MVIKEYCSITNLPILIKPEWIDILLEKEYKVSFYLIGNSILHTVPEGNCGKGRRSSLLAAREKMLRDADLWNKPHIELENYGQARGLPSRESRAEFTDFLMNEEKRGKLLAYFGYNAITPLRWIFNISLKPLTNSSWACMVADYKTAIMAASSILNNKPVQKKEQDSESQTVYTKKEIEQYVDELLTFMESLTWYKNNLEIKEVNSTHPFKILYDIISVIKMDFQAILSSERRNIALIKANEEKYRILSENSQDTIFILDREQILQSIAGNTLLSLGYEKEELLTMNKSSIFTLFHPNDITRLQQESKNLYERGQSSSIEARFRQKDGTYCWLELSLTPLYEGNQIVGMHGFARNIEHHKQTEEKLNIIQQQLVETALSAGKVELSTGILHDIGNILNSVNICTDNLEMITNSLHVSGLLQANELLNANIDHIGNFLQNDPKGKLLPEYYTKVGESIKSTQNKLKSEVAQLKTKVNTIKEMIFTQQKYGKYESQLEKFDLCSTIDDALILQGSFLKKIGIQIEKKYDETSKLIIKAQRSKLIHVLINIFKNAAEAMTDVALNQRRITIGMQKTGEGGIVLSVIDYGTGIETSNLENIFHYGVTTKADGHGYGLHTSKNYITEMGGKLYAKSAGAGAGTTLFIEIPAYIIDGKQER